MMPEPNEWMTEFIKEPWTGPQDTHLKERIATLETDGWEIVSLHHNASGGGYWIAAKKTRQNA